MGLNYDKYINRLKARRAENPAYEAMRRATTAFAEPTMAANRQIQGSLSRAGGSIGARAQIQQSAQQQMLSGQQQIMNSIPVQDTTNIDNQIMNLEMARDQERDAQKDATLKSILEIGGTVLGAGVGLAAGNPMIGAQIGAGAGQMAGSFVGGGGKYGMNYMNREELMQGVGDTIAGISAAVSLGQQKKLAGDIVDKYPLLDEDELKLLYGGIASGNIELIKKVLAGAQGMGTFPVVQGENINIVDGAGADAATPGADTGTVTLTDAGPDVVIPETPNPTTEQPVATSTGTEPGGDNDQDTASPTVTDAHDANTGTTPKNESIKPEDNLPITSPKTIEEADKAWDAVYSTIVKDVFGDGGVPENPELIKMQTVSSRMLQWTTKMVENADSFDVLMRLLQKQIELSNLTREPAKKALEELKAWLEENQDVK